MNRAISVAKYTVVIIEYPVLSSSGEARIIGRRGQYPVLTCRLREYNTIYNIKLN